MCPATWACAVAQELEAIHAVALTRNYLMALPPTADLQTAN